MPRPFCGWYTIIWKVAPGPIRSTIIILPRTRAGFLFYDALHWSNTKMKILMRQKSSNGEAWCPTSETFFYKNWYPLSRWRKKPKLAPHTLYQVCLSWFGLEKLSIKWYSESAPQMTQRPLSQQPDPNRIERPFLYYIPSNQQVTLPKPHPKGNPRSISRTSTERLISVSPVYQPTRSDQERTMFQREWTCS